MPRATQHTRDMRLLPSIDWLHTANRLRMIGDRLGARECLRLARKFRLLGRRACKAPLP